MKIFFENGKLTYTKFLELPVKNKKYVAIVDAKEGFAENKKHIEYYLKEKKEGGGIYTNSLVALSNIYCWNEEDQTPDLYLRDAKGEWKRCQELTEKEIRYGHNLEHLYCNGVFDEAYNKEDNDGNC